MGTGDPYRKLVTGPMKVLAHTPRYVQAVVRYVKAKCLVAGTTTSQGIALSSYAGMPHYYRRIVRNVERTDEVDLPEALTHIADVEARDRGKFLARLRRSDCLLLHPSEGTNAAAREHFLALQASSGEWAITGSLAGIHCVALEPSDFEVLAAAGASMVWSPLSNLLLYGKTAKFNDAKKAGVRFGLGPDWSPSGSKNLLGELKVARLVGEPLGLSDFDILSAVTRTTAEILHCDKALGTLEEKKRADLLIVRGKDGDPYRHLVNSSEREVALVVINGAPRYGDSRPMRHLLGDASSQAEPAMIADHNRLLHLGQASGDPDVGKITLAEAITLLKYGLASLPQLAKDLLTHPTLEQLDGTAQFLVLDHDDLAGVDLRPHLPTPDGQATAELPAAAAATPLDQLLVPLELDPLTVIDDGNFFDTLENERNLPAGLAADLAELY